jgi:hypothetical protein
MLCHSWLYLHQAGPNQKPVLCGSLIFQRTTGSGYLKNSESKNHWFQVFEKQQNQRSNGSVYFKTLKEPPVFMKDELVLPDFFSGYLNLFTFAEAVPRVGTMKILFVESVGGRLFLNLTSVGYMHR